jgi:hypothetical protein
VEFGQPGDDLADLVADVDRQFEELVGVLNRFRRADFADAHVDALEVLEADALGFERFEVDVGRILAVARVVARFLDTTA